jgi:hypothetical protein
MSTDNIISISQHTTTFLVAMWMLAGSVAIFLKKEFIHKTILRLGHPQYFIYILGTAKLIGAAFLLGPFQPLFKTLAFGGATIELLSATISYYVVDRKFSEWVKPVILLLIVWAAFLLWRLDENLGLLA